MLCFDVLAPNMVPILFDKHKGIKQMARIGLYNVATSAWRVMCAFPRQMRVFHAVA